MNNSFFAKIAFFIVIELIGFGFIFKNQEIIFFGVFTAVALLFLFLDLKNLKNNSIVKDKFQKNHISLFIESDFLDFIKYFFRHWGFVLSTITIVLAIFDTFVLKFFNINLFFSFLFFIVSLGFVYKDVMNGNVYLGNQRISSKDILFIMSGVLTLSIFVFLKKIPLIDKGFFSIVSGFLFYTTMIYSLGYSNMNMKLFKSKIITIYIILLIGFSGLFTYSKIQGNFKKNTKEKTISKDSIENSSEKKQSDEEDRFTTYIAPNKKLYDIHLTTTGAWFLGYNSEKKYFKNIEEATKLIDLSNSIHLDKENIENLSGNDNDLSENIEKADIIIDQLIDLFEEKDTTEIIEESASIELEEKTRIKENITYYNLIPLVVNKFKLSSDSKPNVIFDNIINTDENYNYFKTAYYYKMIGRNFNPKSKVQCKTIAVLIGLAENPDTNYTSSDVFDVFWKTVDEKYNISACCKEGEYIEKTKITCILN